MTTNLENKVKQVTKEKEERTEAGGVGRLLGRIAGYAIVAALATKYEMPPGVVAALALPIVGFAEVTGGVGKYSFKAMTWLAQKTDNDKYLRH